MSILHPSQASCSWKECCWRSLRAHMSAFFSDLSRRGPRLGRLIPGRLILVQPNWERALQRDAAGDHLESLGVMRE